MKKLLAALLLILCAGPSSAQVAPVAYNATTALANGLVVKNVGPGRMFGFQALNNNAAVRFILVYDAAAAPADGTTTPTMWYALAGSASAPNNSITVSL